MARRGCRPDRGRRRSRARLAHLGMLEPGDGQVRESCGLVGEHGVVEEDLGRVVPGDGRGVELRWGALQEEEGAWHFLEHVGEVLRAHERVGPILDALVAEDAAQLLQHPG